MPVPRRASWATALGQGIGRLIQRQDEERRIAAQTARQQKADELAEFGTLADLTRSGFRPRAVGRLLTGSPITPESSPMLTETALPPPEPVTSSGIPVGTFRGQEFEFVDPKEAERERALTERGNLAAALGRARNLSPEQIEAVRLGAGVEDVVAKPVQRRTSTETIGNSVQLIDLDTGDKIRDLGPRPPSQAATAIVPGGAGRYQVVQSGDGFVVVDKLGLDPTRPVPRPEGGVDALQTTTQKSSRAELASNIGVIDDALAELQAYPKGVGLRQLFIPDPIAQRKDPKGVAVRSLVANVGSLEIRRRSGAAVTAAEFPRLQPFIPSINDSPETVRTKLAQLKNQLQKHYNALDTGQASPLEQGMKDVSAPQNAARKYPENPYRR